MLMFIPNTIELTHRDLFQSTSDHFREEDVPPEDSHLVIETRVEMLIK